MMFYEVVKGSSRPESWMVVAGLRQRTRWRKSTINTYLETMTETIAIIVGIQDYRFNDKNGIIPVKFANNDVALMKSLFKDSFGVADENVHTFVNEQASKSAILNEIPYIIRQLKSGDRLLFYYVGHGFYQNGYNKFTAFDTHPNNFDDTTVSIKELLMDPIEKSDHNQSIIFIDSCASRIKDRFVDRNLVANLNKREFEEFVTIDNFTAIFMSCSPGEKSYPSSTLQNGIWTYHLANAIKGSTEVAVDRDRIITDRSLSEYLSIAIPKYITEKTNIAGSQNPYAKISSKNTFAIIKLPEKTEEINTDLPILRLNVAKILYYSNKIISVKSASGFHHNHFAPKTHGGLQLSFIRSAFEEELKDEIQAVYRQGKEVLGLRRKDFTYDVDKGSGHVDCSFFRYAIEIYQDDKKPDHAFVERYLTIRKPIEDLSSSFGDIFPKRFEKVKVPLKGDYEFDDLVDTFEKL